MLKITLYKARTNTFRLCHQRRRSARTSRNTLTALGRILAPVFVAFESSVFAKRRLINRLTMNGSINFCTILRTTSDTRWLFILLLLLIRTNANSFDYAKDKIPLYNLHRFAYSYTLTLVVAHHKPGRFSKTRLFSFTNRLCPINTNTVLSTGFHFIGDCDF